MGISRALRLRTEGWGGDCFGSFCRRFDNGLFGLFGLESADFGERAPDDAVRLGAGTVDCGLGAEEVLVEHGVFGGLFREGGFDLGAAAETPGGSDYLGGEELLGSGLCVDVLPEGAGEGLIFFRFVGLDAVLFGEQAEAEGVLGGAGAAFGGTGAG
jgi:hypothetical protein